MNKKFKIIFSVLLIAVSAGLVSSYILSLNHPRQFVISLGTMGNGYVTAVLNCSFPEVPSEVPVLKVVRYYYTEEEAKAIARDIFNITGEVEVIPRPIPEGDMAIEIVGQNGRVCLFYEGSIHYAVEYDPRVKPNLPSFERAKEIADDLLAKTAKLRNPSLQIVFERVYEGGSYADSLGTSHVTNLCVRYDVRYANVSIVGGSEVCVDIGDNGRILFFQGSWRNVGLGNYSVPITVTPEQALMNMAKDPGKMRSDIEKIVINSMQLGYYAEGVLTRQDTILPVYIVEGTMITKNGETYPYYNCLTATSST